MLTMLTLSKTSGGEWIRTTDLPDMSRVLLTRLSYTAEVGDKRLCDLVRVLISSQSDVITRAFTCVAATRCLGH